MRNRFFNILILSVFFFQCQNNKNGKNESKILKPKDGIEMIDKIKITLNRQKSTEDENQDELELDQTDLDVLSDLIIYDIKNKGYSQPNEGEFLNKINVVFRVNMNCLDFGQIKERYIVHHGNLMDGKKSTLENNMYGSFADTDNLFFDKKNRLVTNFMYLKNIVSVVNENYSYNTPRSIVERNKYLFNDNKVSFAWLKFNDQYFLESLVKTFGYVEDKELSKFVLDKNLKDNEELGKVIWNKTCDGKLQFNNEIIQIIKESPNKDKYLEAIENYLGYMLNNEDTDLDFSFKAEIMARLAYYATEIVGDQSSYYYKFFTFVSSEEYQKEFEKRNYYNLKDFKDIYMETKTGGISYPGME